MAPIYRYCIDIFGVDRCMFASNFSPDRASCSYTALWNSFKLIADMHGCTAEEKQKLLHGNAVRIYGVE